MQKTYRALIQFKNGLTAWVTVQGINIPLARQVLEAQYAGSGTRIMGIYS